MRVMLLKRMVDLPKTSLTRNRPLVLLQARSYHISWTCEQVTKRAVALCIAPLAALCLTAKLINSKAGSQQRLPLLLLDRTAGRAASDLVVLNCFLAVRQATRPLGGLSCC